jgi:hypothetical protein
MRKAAMSTTGRKNMLVGIVVDPAFMLPNILFGVEAVENWIAYVEITPNIGHPQRLKFDHPLKADTCLAATTALIAAIWRLSSLSNHAAQ